MNTIQAYIYAARLRTLPLSLSGAISSGAIAYYLGAFDLWVFGLVLLTVVLLQIISNYANDLGDGLRGTDGAGRIGPVRAYESGLLTQSQLKRAIYLLILLALISGILLLYVSHLFWWQRVIFFIFGLMAILAANLYTRGRSPYGYRGLGDLSVFGFFGILGVMGSVYMYLHVIHNASWLVAVGIGALSVSVLHLNNMRDMENDARHQKQTIALWLGLENSKLYFTALILVGIVCWGSFVVTQNYDSYMKYIYWIGFLSLLLILVKFWQIKEVKGYDRLLGPVSMSIFVTAVLFFVSQTL